MSQENVEVVRRIYAETAEGRLTTCLHLFHPEVEYSRQGLAEGGGVGLDGTWHGREAMVRAAWEWVQTFELLRVQAERFIDAGDAVVVFTRQSGKAKASGFPFEADFADVMHLRDGLVVRMTQYRTREAALEAVGLRE
jgi:ketosteroid isomerase-like protein